MHYKLLRSGMQAPGALWAGLDAEIDGLPGNRYRELESLVLESSVESLQQSVASGDMSYEELTLFYLARIRESENDPARY